MAVNRILPFGTKVVFDENDWPFCKGEVGTVISTENELDGRSHLVFTCGHEHWARDRSISEVNEGTEVAATAVETVDIPITFGAIVNGLAEDVYPVGRRFKTPATTDSMELIYAEVFEDGDGNKGLRWENGEAVQLDADVISDPWFIELEFSSEFKQLEFQEEESDTSMVATVFDDGSATVEITEEGIGETMIGLTQQQVQQLQELLLYKADN